MNTSDMLTPEERELARLLGRHGQADAGPSASVDARIMAMARNPQLAAVEPAKPVVVDAPPAANNLPPPRTRATGWSRRRRAVSSLAAVASLVLVVGLAWQLRPLPPQTHINQTAGEMPEAVPADAPMAADAAAEAVSAAPVAEPVPAPVAPPPPADMMPPPPAPTPAPMPKPQPRASAAGEARTAPAPQPVEPMPVFAPPSPAAPPAPPPAPVATAPAPASVQLDEISQAPAAQEQGQPLNERAARQRSLQNTPATNANKAVAADQAMQARPAAAPRMQAEAGAAQRSDIDADAALPVRDWLTRIRERRDAGDIDGARASLKRFARDYPEARIPRDLRPLLQP